ncbi:putative TonB-like protein [Xanthomonas fragariae]|uniref:Putative TonB-like protein n=1 Tax=Xanthomonas fragariae TaxID=48664 RepID=A0A1Y6HNQ0_9XANT|nr:TonB-like protein [Xanthomonas fragariae LMG 25863]SMQ93964.1 putative TonB-like protein [Xanthomonas fragariae]SMQ97783.1 Regulatory protein BlaR1 [Xanthomonas fragariae]SMR04756.1 putative TonB-like protein [Xanthomonas fragariae]
MRLDPLVLLQAMLCITAALLACLFLRRPLRAWLGATAAYAIWASVPLALMAAALPGRPTSAALLKLPALVAMPLPLTTHGGEHGWTQFLVAAWLAGAAVMAVVLWWRQQRFVRSMGPLHALDNVLWMATHDVGLPAALGIWRPGIVVPMDFNARYTAGERALILTLRRGDLHANLLAALLLCIAWFNPLMHLAWRAFRLDQELACDAAVLARYPSKRRSYATTMLKCQLGSGWTPLACHWVSSHPLAHCRIVRSGDECAACPLEDGHGAVAGTDRERRLLGRAARAHGCNGATDTGARQRAGFRHAATAEISAQCICCSDRGLCRTADRGGRARGATAHRYCAKPARRRVRSGWSMQRANGGLNLRVWMARR